MDIKHKHILVLGGWGLVGSAVVRRLCAESPKRIVVTSRVESEAREAATQFGAEFPQVQFEPWWGNIFFRHDHKDEDRTELLKHPATRREILHDIFDDLNDELVAGSALYRLITESKPDIIVDCVNTATAIAYQDIFSAARSVLSAIDDERAPEHEQIEHLIASLYVPQLIRHIQILGKSLLDGHTGLYLKIGTSGTGGMGLNIPYTHSEERPSRVLLAKSSVAGAHTMLLFLMGRSPDAPIVKEIKPTATIGWKRIGYGEIRRHGISIPLVDSSTPVDISSQLHLNGLSYETPLGRALEGVFIDTGENGIFSRGEFETVTSLGQMEMVTAEEIAENVAREIRGTNTGKEVISALDGAVMEPTYRAGVMRSLALEQLETLEREHGDSVAFEMLGPPRLSKLLFEAYLLQQVCANMRDIPSQSAAALSSSLCNIVNGSQDLRSRILSIGIPILLPDGMSLLRSNHIKIPPFRGSDSFVSSPALINQWAEQGWVDLRPSNVEVWQRRIQSLIEQTHAVRESTGSEQVRTIHYWNNFETIPVGKLVSWIFAFEDHGERMKP